MGCHRNFWAIIRYIFEIHGSILKPNKIWKSHLPFQQYMNKELRFQISAKSDKIWKNYITFSDSRSWIHLEVAVYYTAAPRCQAFQAGFHGDSSSLPDTNIGICCSFCWHGCTIPHMLFQIEENDQSTVQKFVYEIYKTIFITTDTLPSPYIPKCFPAVDSNGVGTTWTFPMWPTSTPLALLSRSPLSPPPTTKSSRLSRLRKVPKTKNHANFIWNCKLFNPWFSKKKLSVERSLAF